MFSCVSPVSRDNTAACPHSAEALMNAGFKAKELGQNDEALQVFAAALAAKPSESAIPYLLIEIGSILKSKGCYDEAIQLFADGQKLPGLMRNNPIQREFINIIAYLRITKNILLAKRFGLVPFSQIPPDIILAINTEYAEWNKLEEAI